SCAKALELIRYISQDVEVGKIYKGTITRIMAFGAFCEVLPGREGLIHISELSNEYVGSVEEVVKVGDQVEVRVIEVDKQGRVNLSIKQLKAESVSVRPRRESNEVGEGSGPKRGRRF
ncbi:MAG: S1 RNA-binding domain-containing protein, partial [Candidatus Omnitrophica bacterium]|nr:S1 RNA-binding domain-containing protein [Candidatus Omnitrophota bacterium]